MGYFCFVFLFIFATCNNVETVLVRVNEGLLNGICVYQSNNLGDKGQDEYGLNVSINLGKYYSFKGIPYAEPPVGKLRFRDPIPHKPWKGVRQAILHGPICVQYDVILEDYPPSSEDCLYLNIYSPKLNPEILMPVMFYIHGGSFMSGSGNSDLYNGDFIVQKRVVFVTINYRLDALGFLKLDTKEVPGNAGLKDQRLALKWVHDNIHKFGGNPDEVTIMGQSAGSASVIYHMMSPMSRGLYKRTIAMSGVPLCEWAYTHELTKRSIALGKLLGNDTDNPREVLEFLQSLPAIDIVNRFPIVIPEEKNWHFGFKMTAFQPAPEKCFGQKRFLVESPIETLKRGNINPVDLLIGYTSMEGLILLIRLLTTDIIQKYNKNREIFIPREVLLDGTCPNNTTSVSDEIYKQYYGDKPIDSKSTKCLVQYTSDEVFVYSIRRFLKHLPCGFKKYLYKFSIISPRNRFTPLGVPFGITGVAHTDDLPYLFKSKIPSEDFVDNTVNKLINQTVTLFTNFAKYGNPTPDDSLGVIWPEYDNESKCYMNINKTLTTGNDADAELIAFWTDIYKKGGIELP